MNTSHLHDLTVAVGPADHVLGARQAPVTIVEYGDFECPDCKQAAPALKHIVSRFDGKARLVYRHFPLEEVHPHALHAAMAAETAGAQGKFWEMHDLLFANQSRLELSQLRSYAGQLELDLEKYDSEMHDELYRQRVREGIEGARSSGVRSTPGIFVDGKRHDVSFGLDSLAKAVSGVIDGLSAAASPRETTELIRDARGNLLGSIETAADGSRVLRDADGRVRGYYDPATDHTRGPDQRILAKGDALRSLIC